MFPFSRQKKISRDLSNGLVFGWRGDKARNLSFIFSFLLVALLFIGLFSLISFSNRIGDRPKHSSSEFTLLGDWHPLSRMAERLSPFPERWDPYESAAVQARLSQELRGKLSSSEEVVLQWKSQPNAAPLVALPSVLQRGVMQLPKTENTIVEMEVSKKTAVYACLAGDDFVRSRLPVDRLNYPNHLSPEWYGAELRWLVGIDDRGHLEHCLLLDRISGDGSVEIENWLRRLDFSVGSRGAGVLTLTLEAKL